MINYKTAFSYTFDCSFSTFKNTLAFAIEIFRHLLRITLRINQFTFIKEQKMNQSVKDWIRLKVLKAIFTSGPISTGHKSHRSGGSLHN